MNIAEYQRWTRSTWNGNSPVGLQKVNAILGLCGEVGEVAEVIKKQSFHSKYDENYADFIDDLTNELGDVLYYLNRVADLHGIPIDNIMLKNVKKLSDRHKNGFHPRYSANHEKVTKLINEAQVYKIECPGETESVNKIYKKLIDDEQTSS